jgi:hypothetical protein
MGLEGRRRVAQRHDRRRQAEALSKLFEAGFHESAPAAAPVREAADSGA